MLWFFDDLNTLALSRGGVQRGDMSLLEIQNQDDLLISLYRGLIDVMRRFIVKGKEFIGMANEPVSNICGEL